MLVISFTYTTALKFTAGQGEALLTATLCRLHLKPWGYIARGTSAPADEVLRSSPIPSPPLPLSLSSSFFLFFPSLPLPFVFKKQMWIILYTGSSPMRFFFSPLNKVSRVSLEPNRNLKFLYTLLKTSLHTDPIIIKTHSKMSPFFFNPTFWRTATLWSPSSKPPPPAPRFPPPSSSLLPFSRPDRSHSLHPSLRSEKFHKRT